ncbi:hypothetical protein NQ318_016631 [Aromia moschata]|uniref:Uncharacterized protein n=1 Tax=Aromia moschata TaxID=1265417 RepID=A0AAV8X8Q8_9CUCU|nr:hypothetical protein NQ318_016631 [Aromia moschata]
MDEEIIAHKFGLHDHQSSTNILPYVATYWQVYISQRALEIMEHVSSVHTVRVSLVTGWAIVLRGRRPSWEKLLIPRPKEYTL